MVSYNNNLLEQPQSLEKESTQLESLAFDNLLCDSVTAQHIKNRKSWLKNRMPEVKSVLYSEVIA